MRVRYTATARREFNQTVDYLLEHAPLVAAGFADSVEEAVAELLDHPYSAQATDHPGVRRKYITRFRHSIFYEVDSANDELVILNIRHAARRWPWEDAR
jgi:plasmid stabilization system protein ParE